MPRQIGVEIKVKIKYNAPTTLTFSLLCFAVFIVNTYIIPATGSSFGLIDSLFTVPSSVTFDPSNPLDYLKLFTHIFGHANWTHLIVNLSYILILGPMLESSYGSINMALMILVTGFATGVINVCFFQTTLLGASGAVFMMVLLSSFTNHKKNEIPLTFILVVVLFLGREIVNAFGNDDISQFAHLAGGLCGSLFGFFAQAGQSSRGTAKKAVSTGKKPAGSKTRGAAFDPDTYQTPALWRKQGVQGGERRQEEFADDKGIPESRFGFADLARKTDGLSNQKPSPKKGSNPGFFSNLFKSKTTGISEVDEALSSFEKKNSFKD